MASKIHRNIITATLPDERHFTDPTSILIGTTVARRGPRTYSGGVFTFELTMELAASSAERWSILTRGQRRCCQRHLEKAAAQPLAK